MPDILMDHVEVKKIVDRLGWDGFINHFNKLYEKQDYQFYSCGQSWYEDPRYICKLKGRYGDLIIGWFGVHDQTVQSKDEKDAKQLLDIVEYGKKNGKSAYESLKEAGYIRNPLEDFKI